MFTKTMQFRFVYPALACTFILHHCTYGRRVKARASNEDTVVDSLFQREHKEANSVNVIQTVSEKEDWNPILKAGTFLAVNPVLSGTAMGTMIVAKAANAIITYLRQEAAKRALAVAERAANAIVKRKSEACLYARFFQVQAILANQLVLGCVDGVISHSNTSQSSNKGAAQLNSAALVAVDSTARHRLFGMQRHLHLVVYDLCLAVERLVQSSCHTTTANEFILFEKVDDIKSKFQEVQKQLTIDTLSLVAEVGMDLTSFKQDALYLTDNEVKGEFGDFERAMASTNTWSAEWMRMKMKWDEAAKLLVSDMDNLAEASSQWRFMQVLTSKVLAGLGGFAAVFIVVSTFTGEAGGEISTLYLSSLQILVKGRSLFWQNRIPATHEIISIFDSLLKMLISALGLAGAEMNPGLAYAQITLRTTLDMVQLAENSIAYAEEGRELARVSLRAESTAIEHQLSYTQATCNGLHQVHELAKKEQQVVIQLASMLGGALTGGTMKQALDGNQQAELGTAAADAALWFCHMFPSMCNALAHELSAKSPIAETVQANFNRIAFLSDVAPISDLAFTSKGDASDYRRVGFRRARGLKSLLVCRGCGPTAIFRVALVKNANDLIKIQRSFADAKDSAGSSLPKGATLNFVQYSDRHFQIAFYKAPIKEILAKGHGVLVDLRSFSMVLEEKIQEAGEWRKQIHSALAQPGVHVLGWEKDYRGNGILTTIRRLYLPRGNISRVYHSDGFSALTATFLPATSLREDASKSKPEAMIHYWDFRDSVPRGMNSEFTHASTLKGCGCQLLFSSEYVTFLPGWLHEDLRNVRIAPIFEPNEFRQKDRCGWSVGIWLSSAPIVIPSLWKDKGDLTCELTASVKLKTPVVSTSRNHLYLYESFVGDLKEDNLGEINVPGVLGADGHALDRVYVFMRGPFKKTKKPDALVVRKALEDLSLGGPMVELVGGVHSALCHEDVVAQCTFSDESLKDAVASTLKDSRAKLEVPASVEDFTTEIGAQWVETSYISEFGPQCHPQMDFVTNQTTLQGTERALGGQAIPVISHKDAKLPDVLYQAAENNFKNNCDFTYWTIFSLCLGNKAGYAYVDQATGTLKADCSDHPDLRPGSARVGPTRAVFLRVSFGDGTLGSFGGSRERVADAVALRDGFVIFAPSGYASYKSEGKFVWKGEFLLANPRHVFIQAYVQLDPRINATRVDSCDIHL